MTLSEILRTPASLPPLNFFDLEKREVIENYAQDVAKFLKIAENAGVSIATGNSKAWAILETLPLDELKQIQNNFRSYRNSCEYAFQMSQSPNRQKALLWRMISELGLRPCSDLFDRLDETDIVEIYDVNFRQIFCNLNFFAVSSYTFEELKHLPMAQLFDRPPELMGILMNEIMTVLKSDRPVTLQSTLPKHICKETQSIRRYIAEMNQGIISPLFDQNNQVVAVATSLSLKIFGKDKDHSVVRELSLS